MTTSLTRRAILQAAAALPALGQKTAPPNVVLVITDDQGYGDLGCHGNRNIKTPNLDAFHARAIRLTDFHVSPTCAPTRSALFTGRYSNATGVWHTIMGRSILARDEVTLADCFRASGYRTGLFGKWHLGDNYPSRPQDRGFDEAIHCGGGGIWQAPDHFGNDYQDDTYRQNGRRESFKGYCTDVWFDQAMGFMDRARQSGRPFFCYLATNAPHSPMWAPDAYAEPYKNTAGLRDPGFYGMITNIDDNWARLVNFLRSRGLESNTILIFMTDNGTSDGAQVHNAGMRGAKGSPYEGGHRVPFFLSWPAGGLGGGRDIPILTAHIDILPTLLELCGLKRPAGPPLHGRSLVPLLRGAAGKWRERVLVTDSQRELHLIKSKHTAVMTQNWRLVNPTANGDPARWELYDLRKDPGQKQDLVREHPEIVARLLKDYEQWWKLTAVRAGQRIRIVVGSDKENPVALSSHDWMSEGALAAWNQRQIRQAPVANGSWFLDVERAGNYTFELRRWPVEVDLPITAPYADREPNRESVAGKAIAAVRARLKIGGIDQEREIRPGDKAVSFSVALRAGPAELQTWFYEAGGTERGAYYVYVRRLSA